MAVGVCVCKLGAKSAATKPTAKRLCLASLALPVMKEALLGRFFLVNMPIYPKTHARAQFIKPTQKRNLHFVDIDF
jgi:hypothetical protein